MSIFDRDGASVGETAILDSLFVLFAQPVEMELRHFERFIILIFFLLCSRP
jgi:hypothetical protein